MQRGEVRARIRVRVRVSVSGIVNTDAARRGARSIVNEVRLRVRVSVLYIASPHPSPNQVQRGDRSPQRAAARRARTNAAAPRARYGRCLGRCRGGNNEPTPRVKRAARGPSRTRTSHEKVWIGPPQSERGSDCASKLRLCQRILRPSASLTLCRRGTSESLGILVQVRTTLRRTPTVTHLR